MPPVDYRFKTGTAKYPLLAPLSVLLLTLLGLTAYYRQRWPTLANFVLDIDSCNLLFCDYALVFHEMGKQILLTGVASFGFFYSAFFAILLHPLAVLPKDQALLIWGLLQAASTLVLLLAPWYLLKKNSVWLSLLYAGLLATSVPVLHNLKWGQVSIFITAGTILCLYLYERKHIYLAATLLAALISIKYYPALFCVYFVFRRDWRFVGALLLGCLFFWLGIPLLTLGFEQTWSFQQSVVEGVRSPLAYVLRNSQNSQYIGAVFSRLFSVSAHTDSLFVPAQITGYLLTAVNILLSFKLVRTNHPQQAALSFLLLFLSLPLLLATSWPHYFVYLPFAQAYMFICIANLPRQWLAITAVLLTIGSMMLSSVFLLALFPNWLSYSSKGLLFFSDVALLLAYQIYVSIQLFCKKDLAVA
jgi:hypothetical protein